LILDCSISEEGVLEEAKFYNIQSIVQIIQNRMTAREVDKVR